MRTTHFIVSVGLTLISWKATAQVEAVADEPEGFDEVGFSDSQKAGHSRAGDEKAALEQALGHPLTGDYRLFIHEQGLGASFIDYYHDKLMHKRKVGIILTAAVTPLIIVLSGVGVIVPQFTSEDAMGADILSAIFGFGGGICALATLIPGAVMLGIANSRLKRISHLQVRNGGPGDVSWKFEFGLSSVKLVF